MLGAAAPAGGQLPSPDARHLAVAETDLARVRGFGAASMNPAVRALADAPSISAAFLPLRLEQGLGPVGLGDLADREGRTVPARLRERWLRRIEDAGAQRGSARIELSGAAVAAGPLSVQISTVAAARGTLTPDAAELLLFGNAGRTGTPRELTLAGSSVEAFAATTLGVGVGHRVEAEWLRPGERLTVGATLKYTVGHYVLMGRDAGSVVSDVPVDVTIRFPVIESRPGRGPGGAGSGAGIDVGAAWEKGPWSAGLAIRNLAQTFRWRAGDLRFRPGSALFGAGEGSSDFDPRPVAEAPASLRRDVLSRGFAFPRTVAAGVARRVGPRLVLTAQLRGARQTPLRTGPVFRTGAGAELRLRPGVSLRAGAAASSDGVDLATGLGARLGSLALDAGGALRIRARRNPVVLQLTASWRRPVGER